MYHEHPIRILKYSIKNLWLLIFPLIRGIHAITFDVGKLYHWIKGAWFDIAITCGNSYIWPYKVVFFIYQSN